jgi:hypothetical protein
MGMKRAVILICAAALVLSTSLQATVTIPTDLTDVVSLSTLIVRGRVVDTRAFTDVANGPVVTAVTVSVSEVLKGTADAAVTFRVHGGDLGRYRQVMIGAPTFRVGDDAYLFLKRASDGGLWTVGMGAGVYKITPAALTGPLMVNPPVVAGVTATAGAQVVRGDARRKPMAVGDFASIVKLLMAVSAGAGK